MKKIFRIFSLILLFLNSLSYQVPLASAATNTTRAGDRSGDQYVTSWNVTTKDGNAISGNTISASSTYKFEVFWEVPDGTFKKGDKLQFSIPDGFKIVNTPNFTVLDPNGEEVGYAKIVGDGSGGYYIDFEFTTNYVETHSDVGGRFEVTFDLSEKYKGEGGNIDITYPNSEGTIVVTPSEGGGPGGGGIGVGDYYTNKKTGDIHVEDVIQDDGTTEATQVLGWELTLGRNTLLGKATDFSQIASIVITDEPDNQKMIPMYSFDTYWKNAYSWKKGFFTTLSFRYGGIPKADMGLIRSDDGTYDKGFSSDVLPIAVEYDDYAKSQSSEFKQLGIEYFTVPLVSPIDGQIFENNAKITITYKPETGYAPDSWELTHKQEWNTATGEANGRVAGVQFTKVDETGKGLAGATFDLYKRSGNNSVKVKSDIVSSANGEVKVAGLTTGDYYFLETKAPAGYAVSDDWVEFTITTDNLGLSSEIVYKDIGTVKNQLSMTYTDLTVKKVWDDKNDQDGIRPQNIRVQLYADNVKKGDEVSLNASNNWTYTWKDLEETKDGTDIKYTVKEVGTPSGYAITTGNNISGTITLTNTHTPETTQVSGEKIWNDNNNQDGTRPSSVVVNLLANGKKVNQQTVSSSNNWKYSFTNLPKYENGKEIEYTVTEDSNSGYSTVINNENGTITNNHTPGQTSVTVSKNWDDKNNQDGIRPQSIRVQLYADGVKKGSEAVLNEANDWTHTWGELDEKADGKTIVYTVKEVGTVSGYETSVNNDNHGNITITNKYTPETTQVSGEKIWNDNNNQDGVRPTSVIVNLLANGKEVNQQTVSAGTNWKYSFTNLPKYENGKEIEYTVTEDSNTDYTTVVNNDKNTITNNHTPGKTSVTVTKGWDDKNDQDAIRPKSIQVQLYANNVKKGDVVTLNEGNDWTHTWGDLDEKADGKAIVYTVKEVGTVNGYETTVNDENHGNITLYNIHKPEETEISGEKKWDDANNQDGVRPNSITVNLLANGKEVDQQVVTVQDNWKYSFTKLPKNENGKEIKYTVTEDNIDDYTTSINSQTGTITNQHTPGKTSATVTKGWYDVDNQDGKRPDKIEVQLYANGEKSGDSVTLNEGNNWTHTWDDLDERANGKDIVYTVKEVSSVTDYDTTINNQDQGNITIANTHTPELTEIVGEKIWDDKDNQDGIRPTSVTVNLLANGVVIDSQVVSESTQWKYSFTDLPKYENGKEIKYTVKENSVAGYTADVQPGSITNTHVTEVTDVKVTKAWHDGDDQDGIRPDDIKVQLYADGVKKGAEVTLNASNKWTHTWDNLDKKSKGKDIVYTVGEIDEIEGYTKTANNDDHTNIVLTNTHKPEETEFSGEKIWNDANNQDGIRPKSITVNLLANGEKVDSKVVTEKENWKYEFTNLPKYDKGVEIDYSVTEDAVANYSADIKEGVITNNYTPGKTSATVTKAWDDNNDKAGKRAQSIQVQLYADGKAEGDVVTLNASNNWTHTWQDLDMKANGKTIVYTVKEVTKVDGYESKVDEKNIGNMIITNTYVNTDSPQTDGDLPKTGASNDGLLLYSGVAVAGIALSALIISKNKKKKSNH
ncbi:MULTISPECIES: Cna B-type domain-containing protein [unclassified Lactococcus]|uniref:Cna B-type domain-containing protein n=1 Tax=unclassified Lactococcus TaxID=2643510 RepID=UPI0011C7E05B|nr:MULTISPECIES: Cna B-type domain-containing protein [unclassified Lactococcus]MQW24005.1 Cna B-type domain-containing protein [Lactococcus sp. dk101]TXK36774.1 Cna B-type domain-containing protein [Lactococcus sp. dk310]TXK47532.1 Cna B-type domain-containing protein [Lactococcus sp. dk322]